MKAVDAAYCAGLIDGEGCIQVRQDPRGWTRALLEVCMTTPNVLRWCADITGFGKVYSRAETRPGRRPVSKWIVSRVSDAENILRACLPYLRVKEGEARAFLVLAHLRRIPLIRGRRAHPKAEQHVAAVINRCKAADDEGAYQEALDLAAYLRQAIYERDGK